MAVDSTPSQVATSALQAIPFGSIIGGPLKACIEAQAMAAQTSWKFIQEVGLNTKENGDKEAVNVTFQFVKDGRMAQLNVPLLTIVPIPYIAINSIDINFKANISASSSSVSETSSSQTIDAGGEAKGKIGYGPFSLEASFKANYSSKKDSKATQSSQYSVEYTMDVAVKAGQDSMPAGMAKVLELLGNSLSVENPKGTLEVNSRNLILDKDNKARLIVTYKNGSGLFDTAAIDISGNGSESAEKTIDGDNVVYEFKTTGDYVVKADGNEIKVNVKAPDASAKTA